MCVYDSILKTKQKHTPNFFVDGRWPWGWDNNITISTENALVGVATAGGTKVSAAYGCEDGRYEGRGSENIEPLSININ